MAGAEGFGGGDDFHRQRVALLDEFRPFVEESLILVIVEEHGVDLSNAREVLAGIAQNVFEEEATGFDPSGFQNVDQVASQAESETQTLDSFGFHGTSVSNESSFTTSASEGSERPPTVVNDLPEDEAGILRLQELFPSLKVYDISRALKSADGDPHKAFEELQTLKYLEDSGQRLKGIEAFFRPDDQVFKKPKGKKKSSLGPGLGLGKNGRKVLPVNYTLAPLDLAGEDDGSGGISRPTAVSRISPFADPVPRPASTAAIPSSSASEWQPAGPRKTAQTIISEEASQLRDSTAYAFQSASQALKRGRSDAAFRGVASYYAKRGQEQLQRARAAESEASELLVDGQSYGNTIDLHGVAVQDGVRIALDRTRSWWDGLGEAKVSRAKVEPLTIVTGMGRHSAGGVSRMRQDVGAALKREGWKVLIGTGQYTVTGRG